MRAEQIIPEGYAQVLHDALDRPIAFHRVFVKLTGSVTAALMLSQAMYWSKRVNSDEGWFFKTITQWEEETGLSRFEQESARKTLRRFSFWKEELRGVPAKMHYRLDVTSLSEELCRPAKSEKPFKNVRLLQTSKLDCGNPANKYAENQQTSLLETGKHYKGISETTTETIKTTTPLIPLEPAPGEPGGRRDFVERLLVGTVLHRADPGRIAGAAKKYNRTRDEIENAIDVLDQQYRHSVRRVDDPTALIVSALKDGIDPPEDYQPVQRKAEREATRKRSDEERRTREAEENAFKEAETRLWALPEKKRGEIFEKARTKVPAILQNSQMAIKTEAIRMMISNAKAPE